MISTHSFHRQKPLSHELGSEWVSKQASEWAQRARECMKAASAPAVRSKRMSERCERTSERTSEWSGTNVPISMNQLHLLDKLIALWVESIWDRRVEYWSTRLSLSARSFVYTAHSFARSAALIRSLVLLSHPWRFHSNIHNVESVLKGQVYEEKK